MNPRFFFTGKLSREESASAFLATLLDQHAEFRAFFFRSLKIEEPKGLCRVSIEHKEVDIRLDYPAAQVVVLIENKVRPGALQVNQLVRYYQQELAANVDSRIISIMISPSPGSGSSEADRLTQHKDFRPSDKVVKSSWRDLSEFCDILNGEDSQAQFIKGGFASVLKIIEEAAQEKFPLLGGRIILHDAAQSAFNQLAGAFPGKLRFWRAKDVFDIYSIGGDITANVDLLFQVENKAPYAPLGMSDENNITATLRTQITLSDRGRRNRPLKNEWNRLCEAGKYDIPGLGTHTLAGRWFKREVEFRGDTAMLQRKIAELGRVVIAKASELQSQSEGV